MIKRLGIGLLVAALFSVWLAGPLYAAGLAEDKIIFGDNFTLTAGQTVDGNLVVLGGNVSVAEGAEVTQSIVVFGGNVEVAGQVGQNVAVFGGNVTLRGTAVVAGELTTVGGSTSRDPGAQVAGGESQGFDNGRAASAASPFRPILMLVLGIFKIVAVTLGLSLLALLMMLFWPEQAARTSAAIGAAPGISGGLGALTFVAAPFILAITAITICLLPLTFLGIILYLAALLMGWLALGMLVGARLSAAVNLRGLSPALSAALGTALFTLVMLLIWLVPCVGWVVPTVLGIIGLGAVVLTRFGSQPYLPGAAPAGPSAPAAFRAPAPERQPPPPSDLPPVE